MENEKGEICMNSNDLVVCEKYSIHRAKSY